MTKYAKVKTNIVTCLECGSYHERGTICGKCYNRVREETRRLHETMFDKEGHFKNSSGYPPSEVRFVYEGEENKTTTTEPKQTTLVEVSGKRPDWFDSNLASKVSTTKPSDK